MKVVGERSSSLKPVPSNRSSDSSGNMLKYDYRTKLNKSNYAKKYIRTYKEEELKVEDPEEKEKNQRRNDRFFQVLSASSRSLQRRTVRKVSPKADNSDGNQNYPQLFKNINSD